jgi:hypothetical protein
MEDNNYQSDIQIESPMESDIPVPKAGYPFRTSGLDFSDALKALREGKKIRRASWGHTVMVHIVKGMFYYPHTDFSIKSLRLEVDELLAEDWEIVE